MNKYRWVLGRADEEAASALARELGVPPAGARLLVTREITDVATAREFLAPKPVHVHDPFLFARMRQAVDIVTAAQRAGRALMIHGDYDVDGISGAALLFHYLNGPFKNVSRFVPDRRKDGYGVADRAVEWAIAEKVGLVIAVDCGTSDPERLRRLEAAGIAVVVCDHHQLPADGDVAGVLLNPVEPGEPYPFSGLCGTGVAYKLVEALHASGFPGAQPPHVLLDLVALATVADMAPLKGENRYLVRAGLERINRAPRPGLEAIRNLARLSASAISARHLSFAFAPRLNAPGRVSRPKPSLEILCVQAKDRAFQLACVLEEENDKRRKLTERVQMDAVAEIRMLADRTTRGGFVLAHDEWDEGVLGIAAARVVEEFGRPAILMSASNGMLKGSGRSIPGIDLKHELDHFQERLVRYGGHAGAVGLTIARDELDRFAEDFSARLREVAPAEPGVPLRVDGTLELAECDLDLLGFLDRCEPFGSGNPEPVWMIRDVQVARETSLVGDGSHLKFHFFDAGGARGSAISFGWDRPQTPEDLRGRALDLAVTLRRGTYQGSVYPDLRVVDVRESGAGA
jgi:single-stranded-DNA-specific exonuclease